MNNRSTSQDYIVASWVPKLHCNGGFPDGLDSRGGWWFFMYLYLPGAISRSLMSSLGYVGRCTSDPFIVPVTGAQYLSKRKPGSLKQHLVFERLFRSAIDRISPSPHTCGSRGTIIGSHRRDLLAFQLYNSKVSKGSCWLEEEQLLAW